MNRLGALIDNGRHPLTRDMLDMYMVQQRVDEAAIIACDPLVLLEDFQVSALGEYDHDRNYGAIVYDHNPIVPRGQRSHRETLWHEYGHIISGRSVQKRGDQILATRTGSALYDSVYRTWRYTWLDEAIIETLTIDMKEPGKRNWNDGEYLKQRTLYRRLLSRIPERLFLGNAFENTQPRTPLQFRPLLVGSFDRAYGQGFFLKLDDMVRQQGIERVMSCFNEKGEFQAA